MKKTLKSLTLISTLILSIQCSKDEFIPCPNCPVITDFTPKKGLPGTILTVSLQKVKDGTQAEVTINGLPTNSLGVVQNNQLQCEVTEEMTTGQLIVSAENPNDYRTNLLSSSPSADIFIVLKDCNDDTTFCLVDQSIAINNTHPVVRVQNGAVFPYKNEAGFYVFRRYTTEGESTDIFSSNLTEIGHVIDQGMATLNGSFMVAGKKKGTTVPYIMLLSESKEVYQEYTDLKDLVNHTIDPSKSGFMQILATQNGMILLAQLEEKDLVLLRVNQDGHPDLKWRTRVNRDGRLLSREILDDYGFVFTKTKKPYLVSSENGYVLVSAGGVVLHISEEYGNITSATNADEGFQINASLKKSNEYILFGGKEGMVEATADATFRRPVTSYDGVEIKDIMPDTHGRGIVATGNMIGPDNKQDILFLLTNDTGTSSEPAIGIDASNIFSNENGAWGAVILETGNGGYLVAGLTKIGTKYHPILVRVSCNGELLN